jgi:CRP/FNR family transcriptional regulator, cyclic AMP receptor protein
MADSPAQSGLPGLSRASAAALLRLATPLSLRVGRVLYYQGDRADRAYLLSSGAVRRVMYRSNESSAELGRCGPGEWLGLAETFLESLYLADAVVETATVLLAFSRPGIVRALDLPGVGAALVAELSRELYTLHGRVEVSLPLDRTARFLLDHAGAEGLHRATQEEIAAAVGLARETVNRHLAELASEGLVEVGRGEVRIANRRALEARCGRAEGSP